MSRILAIEPDQQRRALLMALVRAHVQAEVTMVDTVSAAIARFHEQQPDVILAPTLLSPSEGEQLRAYVQQHASSHVQMMTVPALDMLREPAAKQEPVFALFKRKRPVKLGLQYDPEAVGEQIADQLERALALRDEQAMLRGVEVMVAHEASLALSPISKAVDLAAAPAARDRRWAGRSAQQQVPWLQGVRLPWGTDVSLVNISRTGILVESGSKVTPGVTLELQLSGTGLSRVVLARFVRSEIAGVDRFGVRYHAAATFEQPLDIIAAHTEPADSSSRRPKATPQALVSLLNDVVADSNQAEAASIRFARGLRDLVGARDVLIRCSPMVPPNDSESIYFNVQNSRGPRVLQVMFDRNRELTASEFRLLKAAPGLIAALLELERDAAEDREPAPRQISEVA